MGRLEEVLLELGQLARAVHAFRVYQVGRDDFEIARAGLAVEHEGDEGPLQLGALSLQHGEARAADLGRAIQVEDAEGRAQFHVILGCRDRRDLAPALDLDIAVLIAADGTLAWGGLGRPRGNP